MRQSIWLRWVLLLVVGMGMGGLPAAQAATPQDVPGNVVPDGGFEQQGQGWDTCGGVTFADTQANLPDTPLRVHDGRYAARLGNPTINDGDEACPLYTGYPGLYPSQLLRVPVNIPADATELTVSFWYSRFGPVNPGSIDVFFSDQIAILVQDPGGLTLDSISGEENIGWYEYRQVLRGDDLARARLSYADYKAGRPASGNTYLNFRMSASLTAEEETNVAIDDVAVTFSDRSMPSSPLPAALAGDGTQPLVLLKPIPGETNWGIYRMDTDGSKAQLIYRTRLASVNRPRWSPDGQRIAVIETGLRSFNPDDPTVNPAQADELTILAANGTPLAAPARGYGVAGVKGDPAGCEVRPEQPYCRRSEERAIDALIFSADWSPTSDALVIEFATHGRSSTGAQTDDKASLLRIDGQTPFDILSYDNNTYKINPGGASPSWGANNRILFSDLFDGVYADTPEITLDNAALLIPRLGNILGQRPATFPTWSPDATTFVTVNKTAGGGWLNGNNALVLNDPNGGTHTHTLVVVDYPRSIEGKPTWSPDGNYIVYTVDTHFTDNSETLELWWVDVATGDTGQITTDGANLHPHWRPTAGAGLPAGNAPGGGPGTLVAQGFPAPAPAPLPQTMRAFLPLLSQR